MVNAPQLLLRFVGLSILASQCLLAPPQFLRRDIRVPGRMMQLPRIVDINNDSRPDIVWLVDGSMAVALNTGQGYFSTPIVTSNCLPVGVFADFDSDGSLDLAQSVWQRELGAASFEICFGRGDGSFLPPRPVTGDSSALFGLMPVKGDFNGDQKQDLIVSAREGLTIEGPTNYIILLGNGDGTFRSGPSIEIGFGELYGADLNLDGRTDLILLTRSCPTRPCGYFTVNEYSVSVFLANEDGSFEAPKRTEIPETYGLLVTDLNRDGLPDLATASAVLLGSGDGTFRTAGHHPKLAPWVKPVAAADLTGDGHADLVMYTPCEGEGFAAYVWPGKGDGTMAGEDLNLSLSSGYFLDGMVFDSYYDVAPSAADLDGDGRPDLVTARSGIVTVLLNRSEFSGR